MKKRNSSIELLKILTLFALCFSHCLMSTGIMFDLSTSNVIIIFGQLMRCFGQLGNIIFVTCSSYFLLESTYVKKEKIIGFIFDAFIISMLFLISFSIVGMDINTKDFIKSFFPITFQNNWFITCYIMLYIIHPYLNKIIKSVDKKELLKINVFFVALYSIIQFLLPTKFYFNNLIGFIEIYFITAYVKLYLKKFKSNIKINSILLFIAIMCNTVLLVLTNYLGLSIELLSNKVLMWNNLANPFYIIIAITLFNIFERYSFNNKTINYLSSCSLLFYMIHENLLFRNYVRPLLFLNEQLQFILFKCALVAVIIFIISMVLSLIYKSTIQKIVYKCSSIILRKLSLVYEKIEEVLLKIK